MPCNWLQQTCTRKSSPLPPFPDLHERWVLSQENPLRKNSLPSKKNKGHPEDKRRLSSSNLLRKAPHKQPVTTPLLQQEQPWRNKQSHVVSTPRKPKIYLSNELHSERMNRNIRIFNRGLTRFKGYWIISRRKSWYNVHIIVVRYHMGLRLGNLKRFSRIDNQSTVLSSSSIRDHPHVIPTTTQWNE